MALTPTKVENNAINRIYAALMTGNRYDSAADGERIAEKARLYASTMDHTKALGDEDEVQSYYASMDLLIDMIRENRPSEEREFRTLLSKAQEFSLNSPDVEVPGSYSDTYSGTGSFQPVDPDLELDPDAGSADGSNPKYLAAVMGNLLGDSLTKDANYLGGVIGAYSLTGTKATTYPSGGVLAQISDGVTEADGAVVAYVDGDSAVTKANAAFKAMCNNSNAGSGFDYGLDLTSPSHDGYLALTILKADVRMSNDVCMFSIAGAPVDGVSGTGAGFAGPGSLVVRRDTGKWYTNGNTKASPTWKLITSAA